MPSSRLKDQMVSIFNDIGILILTIAPTIIFELLIDPTERGFFCNDDSIRYPYTDPIVSTAVLLPVSSIGSLVVISLIEYFAGKRNEESKSTRIRSFYEHVKVFLFGFAITVLTVQIFKFSLGSLRPHFISVCNPRNECGHGGEYDDWIGDEEGVSHRYISTSGGGAFCESDSPMLVRNARLSFMSAHASISAYSSLFLISHLEKRLHFETSNLIKPFIQYALFLIAVSISISRIVDHHHHWWDVVAGFINGSFFALVCRSFILPKLNNAEMKN